MTNTITIRGNVGRDAELRFTPNGAAVLEVSVADERSKPDGNGGWTKENTTWWRVKAFGKRAEAAANVRKGDRLVVTGRAELRTYERKDGGEGYSLEVLADAIGVEPRSDSNRSGSPTGSQVDPWGNGGADDGFSAENPPF